MGSQSCTWALIALTAKVKIQKLNTQVYNKLIVTYSIKIIIYLKVISTMSYKITVNWQLVFDC